MVLSFSSSLLPTNGATRHNARPQLQRAACPTAVAPHLPAAAALRLQKQIRRVRSPLCLVFFAHRHSERSWLAVVLQLE